MEKPGIFFALAVTSSWHAFPSELGLSGFPVLTLEGLAQRSLVLRGPLGPPAQNKPLGHS